MDRDKRKKAIKNAIKSLGWLATSEWLKTEEDKQIFEELKREEEIRRREYEGAIMKKLGII